MGSKTPVAAVAVMLASLAFTSTALASSSPTRITITAPAVASAGQDFAVDVHVTGPNAAKVAGFQVNALVNAAGADVVTAIPGLAGARIIDPLATGGSANVGYYGGRPGTAPTDVVAHVLIEPLQEGRLQVRLARPILVDEQGNVLHARVGKRVLVVQIGSKSRGLLRAPHEARSGAHAHSRHSRDLSGDGTVNIGDVAASVSALQSGPGNAPACAGVATTQDVTGDACTTVADVQAVDAVSAPAVKAAVTPSFTTPGMTFVVNTTDDLLDANPGDRICATSAGTCSLRAAIDEANRRSGDDEIDFNIPGGPAQTIQLTTVLTLNAKVGAVFINGYSQPGSQPNTDPLYSNAIPGVVLKGYSTTDRNAPGMRITSAGNIISGLRFESTGRAILMYGPTAAGNTIVGNTFNVTAAGTRPAYTAGYASIMIDGAPNNLIGTRSADVNNYDPVVADRNVVTFGFDGIVIDNPGADGNIVQNNLIGVSPDGSTQWGGSCTGIDHNVGPKHNLVGGPRPSQRNVIDGYSCDGFEWSHGWNQTTGDSSVTYQVNDNSVVGNYLGIRADGTYSPSFINAPGNTGTNDGSSVNIWDITNNNTVDGNWMAANQDGIRNAHNSNGTIIKNNHIGILPNGAASFIGTNGVQIQADSSNVQVLGNQIGHTGAAGVDVVDTNNHFETISRNTFVDVGTLGIDLAPLGVVNPNDAGDADTGANYGLNFPEIASVSTTNVSGTVSARNGIVELFRTRYGLPGENGPGEEYLGTTTANSAGAWSIDLSLNPGDVVTATSTDTDGNTSEFGVNVAVPGATPPVIGVTYEDYRGFTGSQITQIPTGTQPVATARRYSFQSPVNRGDNLGTKMYALLTPPTTDTYTFWIASDDRSALFLSPTADPTLAVQIASVNSSTTVQQWDKEANQHSVAITLQGGQQYYIEAYQKENTGGDHVEVGWSSSTLSRQVILAQYLTPTTAACSGWCPNPTFTGHGVQFDTWTGRNGSLLTNIPQGVLPNTSSTLPTFTAPVNRGNSLGTRLRAILTAPVTGDYTFWISSDDEGKLYISPSTDPSLETMVANVVGSVPAANFDTQANQQSAPVHLTAGQQVFIEAFSKEATGNDHLEVAWTIPGFQRTIIQPGSIVPTTTGCTGWCPK